MKFDAASVKNPFLRRSYVLAIAPAVVVVYIVVAVYEIIKAAVLGIYDAIVNDVSHNLSVICKAAVYCWIGKDEYERRAALRKKNRIDGLTTFTIKFKR